MPRLKQNADMKVEVCMVDPDAKPLEGMDADGLLCIGQKTYQFVRQCMRDPLLRERIRARAAEIRASGYGTGGEEISYG